MIYNSIFTDIPQSYFDYILREKRGKMNLEHFINSGYSDWMPESDLAAIELTEDEMYTYADYYYSRVVNMPKKIDISSLRTNFVNGESYQNEYEAIRNFVYQFNINDEYPNIDIANQAIIYNDWDNDGEEQTIDISQNVFFQDYLSQLTLNHTNDIGFIYFDSNSIILSISNDSSHCSGRIYPNNGYICEESCPE